MESLDEIDQQTYNDTGPSLTERLASWASLGVTWAASEDGSDAWALIGFVAVIATWILWPWLRSRKTGVLEWRWKRGYGEDEPRVGSLPAARQRRVTVTYMIQTALCLLVVPGFLVIKRYVSNPGLVTLLVFGIPFGLNYVRRYYELRS